MSQLYSVPEHIKAKAKIDNDGYKKLYQQSVDDPEGFWSEHGQRITWFTPYTKVKNTSFEPGKVSVKWYEDGTLNACYNCVDRHLADKADKTAII